MTIGSAHQRQARYESAVMVGYVAEAVSESLSSMALSKQMGVAEIPLAANSQAGSILPPSSRRFST
jgi:hypothetical protein